MATTSQRSLPFATLTLAGLCVLAFGLQWLWGDGDVGLAGRRMGALMPSAVAAGEWWRLLSLSVLHISWLHLAQNLLGIIALGQFHERTFGSAQTIVLFLVSAAGGGLAAALRSNNDVSFGASGGLWGLLLVYAVVVTWPRLAPGVASTPRLRRMAWVLVGALTVYSFAPHVDWRAHVGGGCAGLITFAWLVQQHFSARVIRIAAALFTVVWVASIGIALTLGRPWALTESWTLETQLVDGVSLAVPRELEQNRRRAGAGVTQWGQIAANGAEVFCVVSRLSADDSPARAIEREHEKIVGRTFHFVERSRAVVASSGSTLSFSHAVPNDVADARFVWLWSFIEPEQRVVTVMINAVTPSSHERKALFQQIGKSVHLTGLESR